MVVEVVQEQEQPQLRRKLTGIGRRVWLFISERAGDTHVEEVGKYSIMRRTGLPGRDLRVLDPMLSYPSTILGRERAIVINLEHIKAIVTANEVLMLNSTNPHVVQFVGDLQQRVSSSSSSSSDSDSNQLVLPFEFRAVEACLESACRCFESETKTLELEAYPALDELTSKISTLKLERVRQIKSRLVAISGRVQKVRDELEHLLDDDNDMAEMYLTQKQLQFAHSSEEQDNDDNSNNTCLQLDDDDDSNERTQDSENSCVSVKPNIEELEMLLEAYFAQLDGILQKLSDMSEYVNDTEDCINIMLDDKQNQLLQMGVMLTTMNIILNVAIVVTGIFSINIHIALFKGQASSAHFWEIAFGLIGGCVALYLIAIGWCKKKNLLAL